MQKIEFIKMHGLGNDFVIIDRRLKSISITENLIQKLDKKFLTRTLHKGILLHGGGWKKLENQKISNQT